MKISKQTVFDIVKASGENILTYLQGQISQDIKHLSPEQALYAVILHPQGKAVTDFYLLQTQVKENWAEVMFLCPSAFTINLVKRLRMFAMGHELRIGQVSSWQVMSVQGDDVDEFLAQQNLPIPVANKLASAHDKHVSVLRTPELLGRGVWVVGASLGLQANIEENEMACERVLQGIPRLGIDWTTKLHPLNANLIERNGVSFDKGCYVGQEVTSRMQWRGGIKKKLYQVQIGEPVNLPCPLLTTVKVGEITSLVKRKDGEYVGIALLPIAVVKAGKVLKTEQGLEIQVLGACGV